MTKKDNTVCNEIVQIKVTKAFLMQLKHIEMNRNYAGSEGISKLSFISENNFLQRKLKSCN